MTKASEFEQFFMSETSVVDIYLPDGEPMLFNGDQVRAHVFGPATDQYTKATAMIQREGRKALMNTLGKGRKKENEDHDADNKFLVMITEKFDNFPYPGGVEAIYREPKLKYIGDQVRAFVGDAENFFPTGKKD